ncbi:hypothetical protein B0H13DRAFT_1998796 [Mycena leptocephala]|nr:hypothetical protein B0H13DRAFT_1998796 [Mycena leptocephala]
MRSTVILAVAALVSASGTQSTQRKFPFDTLKRGSDQARDAVLDSRDIGIPITEAAFFGGNLSDIAARHGPAPWTALKVVPGPTTNAKRFAMGLPPLPARRGTSAPRAVASPLPPVMVTQTCNILVQSTDSPPSLSKFISTAKDNSVRAHGVLQTDQAGSLEVTFTYNSNDPTALDIVMTNGPDAGTEYPSLGAWQDYFGDTDLSSSTHDRAIIAGIPHIPAGPATNGPSTLGYNTYEEGTFWAYNPASHQITAQWINTDPSNQTPTTYLACIPNYPLLVLTGDIALVSSEFSFAGGAFEVKFTCVPPV